MTNKLLVVFHSDDKVISNELNESECVTVTLELEVKTLSILDNSDGLLVSFVLQDKLL